MTADVRLSYDAGWLQVEIVTAAAAQAFETFYPWCLGRRTNASAWGRKEHNAIVREFLEFKELSVAPPQEGSK